MSDDFAHCYPNANRFIFERGWIEVGSDEYSRSFIRALDPGGLVWEGTQIYDTLDDALADLERGLARWLKEMTGTGDE
jgi:hypothetical protein